MNLDLFRGVVPFVAVAEARSFRRAAASLGVSPAAVSKAVRTLEQSLGTTLFARGQRDATLTREGELFFEHCRPAVTALLGAKATMDSARSEPQGQLVVSVPFVGAAHVQAPLATLHARHPRLTFRLIITDRLSRLGEEPVDVAVRVGPLADSSLVARKLRSTELWTVASPSHLARTGVPQTPDDLEGRDVLVLVSPSGKPWAWRFRDGERAMNATLLLDHGPTLVDAALAGLGITQVFDFMVEQRVRSGDLVRVLADFTAEGPPVHALCAPGRRATPRVRAAFDAFADGFAGRSAKSASGRAPRSNARS
jgi:DNA-binding transcriptional LysR family regulator